MKIFVAGATGVIGRSLLPLLVQAGHEVVGMTHHESSRELIQRLGATPVVADALDRDAVFAALRQARPEVVMHQLTSLSTFSLDDNAKMRIEGTRHLVDAAQAVGVKRMIAQSIAWAYEPGQVPAAEHVPLDINAPQPRKTTIDGVVALEQAVAELPEHVILRYGTLYGPGTWYSSTGSIADQIRNKEIPATDGIRSFVHVLDAAHAAVQALDWPTGPVNLVDDEPAPGTEWLPVFAAAISAPEPEIRAGSQRGEQGASNARARTDYHWQPQFSSWREGFKHL